MGPEVACTLMERWDHMLYGKHAEHDELTTIHMTETEDVTNYLIRAKKAATGLRSAGETISDNFIIAMLLKGLLAAFSSFVVVHTQTD